MSIAKWFDRAQSDGFAIGAFNVANLETFKAVIEAAQAEHSPVIIESSDGEAAFVGPANLVDLVDNARQETGLPIFLNLDHSREPDKVITGIEAGFDLVHYDGSKNDIDTNIRNLRELVPSAHRHHILVEGEADYIIEGSEVRNMSAAEGKAKSVMTDPARAAEFVAKTSIDTFAVSIGNVHGLYTSPKKLDLELLGKIRAALTCYLSLHGGSGISDDQITRAIEVGKLVKINVSTELRQAYHDGLEQALVAQPDEVAMYKITPDVIDKVKQIIQAKMRLFGSSGKAAAS